MEDKFSPLLKWLERGTDLTGIISPSESQLNLEIGGFLILNKSVPIHESLTLQAESLESSWKATREYLKECAEVAQFDKLEDLGSLDHYELELVEEELGKPPCLACPIYLMTVSGKSTPERVVYIGMTSSDNKRFKGGHTAITKLHHPRYQKLDKKLYPCNIILGDDNRNYLPLEWVSPLEYALELLKSIECQLTFQMQPELNTQNKSRDNTKHYVYLHGQNAHDSGFLHDEFF